MVNENMKNADNLSLSEGSSRLPESLTTTKYQEFSNNKKSKARESVVSVSGVTPLIRTLKRLEEEESTVNEEPVAYDVFKKENEVSNVACGRKNSIKVSVKRYTENKRRL